MTIHKVVMNNSNWNVEYMSVAKTSEKPSLGRRLRCLGSRTVDAASAAALSSVEFVSSIFGWVFSQFAKVIRIEVNLFGGSKGAFDSTIKELNGEVQLLQHRNKSLDNENYILRNALLDLKAGGNMTYDKCVQWFGKDCEQAVRWRDAVRRANASLIFSGSIDEVDNYHSTRANQQWLAEYADYEKKKDEDHKGRSSSKRKRKR